MIGIHDQYWKEPDYNKDASLEYMTQYLIKKGIYEPVAMYFRNAYMNGYEESPDGVLDVYHMRNNNEGINSYIRDKKIFIQ